MAEMVFEAIDISDLILRCREGKTKNLYTLIAQLRASHIASDVRLKYVKELNQHVTELGKDFEPLVGCLLALDLSSFDEADMAEYLSLVMNLVSAHTFYLGACVKMIVDNFRPKKHMIGSAVSNEVRQQNQLLFSKLHSLLRGIVKLVPMTSVVLLPLLANMFPFYMSDVYVLQCYVDNLLQLTTYLPKSRGPILRIIFVELTKIDVHIPAVTVKTDPVEMAVDEAAVANDDVSVISNKLDVLMTLMFEHVNRACQLRDDRTCDDIASQKCLSDLLQVFDEVLLPTHASRYVQFIVFYVASLSQKLSMQFLEFLWKKFEDPNVQGVFRQTAVLYIAGYLVHAKHVSIDTVKLYIDTTVAWIRRYIKHSPHSSRPDVKRHLPFYSACQAIFYIFVHRHEDILHTYGIKYCESLYLGSIVTSWLNPLRVCLPHIVTKFASVVRNNRIAFCDTVLDRNRRCRLPETNNSIDHDAAETHSSLLDAFFPFEPYNLTESAHFVDVRYRHVEDFSSHADNVSVKEEELYVSLDTSEKLVSDASNDPKLYDTFHEILQESLQFESSS